MPCSGRCGRGRAGRPAGSRPRARAWPAPGGIAEAGLGRQDRALARLELFANGRHADAGPRECREETGTAGQRAHAEIGGNRLAQIGKRLARADTDTGVQRPRPSAAAARIRGSGPYSASSGRCRGRRSRPAGPSPASSGRRSARRASNRSRFARVPVHVVAVTVQGIEVDEVGQDQPARHVAHRLLHPVHSLVVGGRRQMRVMPRPANRSPILPTATTGRPAAVRWSSRVGSGGSSA